MSISNSEWINHGVHGEHGGKTRRRIAARIVACFGLIVCLAGCRKEDMQEQPRYDPYAPSGFFADGQSARPLVEGTVARSGGRSDSYLWEPSGGASGGSPGGGFPADFPLRGEPLQRKLERGRERFTIFCALCHGDLGDGHGMIVQRGFIVPPSFHLDRLRQAPPGHFFDVMTNGYGAMYSYAARVPPDDRWAIAAYIRTLQLSLGSRFAELSKDEQGAVQRGEALAPTLPAAQPATQPATAPALGAAAAAAGPQASLREGYR